MACASAGRAVSTPLASIRMSGADFLEQLRSGQLSCANYTGELRPESHQSTSQAGECQKGSQRYADEPVRVVEQLSKHRPQG
jgi:hypothetical protein